MDVFLGECNEVSKQINAILFLDLIELLMHIHSYF
jgi:hypothetical protein